METQGLELKPGEYLLTSPLDAVILFNLFSSCALCTSLQYFNSLADTTSNSKGKAFSGLFCLHYCGSTKLLREGGIIESWNVLG